VSRLTAALDDETAMDPLSLPDPATFSPLRHTHGAAGTRALGAEIAAIVQAGDALLLHGPLGAGKTCLVQGLCGALGCDDEVVSPTFTLVNRYRGRVTVDHLDFYRIDADDDLGDIGVHEILDELDAGRSLLVAEWPALLAPLLPRRVELLVLPGEDPQERRWYARGVPELPETWRALRRPEPEPC
jgi:tRNA threonylcarbamoyladenosine biosynthesis protein TsaE